jgi:2-phospho-L-lactate guanylyltransferase
VRVIALPVKSLDEAKSRLSPLLSEFERAALTLAMLEDVLDATLEQRGWATWVISPDEAVLDVALRRGAHPVIEEAPTLTAAIRQVDDEATGRGAEVLATLLPDTPLVTAFELARALHTLGAVVVGPAVDEVGTNMLVRRPPDCMPASYGPDSYRRHLETAAERGLPVSVVESWELGFDLDVPDDILTLMHARKPGRSREVVRELDLPARLAARGA